VTSDEAVDGEDRSVLSRPAREPDRVWQYGPGDEQVADVYLPRRPAARPVALVHGGFWRPEYDRMHLRPMAAALADEGHPVVLPEYARRPGDPDRSLADLRQALAALPPEFASLPPVLIGHSAGGHLVLMLAADPSLRSDAAIALAPVADLVEAERAQLDDDAVRAFLGGPAWLRPDLDPCRSARPGIRVRIVHGMADAIVPIRLSHAYAAAQHVPVVGLAATGHFELIDPRSPAWPAVLAELAAVDGPRVLND
jgi:acetyl esterase/lipase